MRYLHCFQLLYYSWHFNSFHCLPYKWLFNWHLLSGITPCSGLHFNWSTFQGSHLMLTLHLLSVLEIQPTLRLFSALSLQLNRSVSFSDSIPGTINSFKWFDCKFSAHLQKIWPFQVYLLIFIQQHIRYFCTATWGSVQVYLSHIIYIFIQRIIMVKCVTVSSCKIK